MLGQARSELLKQEHQVGSLNCCINELQQQTYAQRLELQDAQHGSIESRREQVRALEESSMKEKVLRDTIPDKIIAKMRGADLIVFRIN